VVVFDSRVFQVIDAREGDWSREAGTAATLSIAMTTSGQLRLVPSRAGGVGVRGEGAVATLRLKVAPDAPAGVTSLQLRSMSPIGLGNQSLPFTLPAPLVVSIAE
jgi:hypothetical protein